MSDLQLSAIRVAVQGLRNQTAIRKCSFDSPGGERRERTTSRQQTVRTKCWLAQGAYGNRRVYCLVTQRGLCILAIDIHTMVCMSMILASRSRWGSDHFIIGGGGWKTFWKNNLELLLPEKIIWPVKFKGSPLRYVNSSYSELHSHRVCFGLFGSRTPAVSRHSLAGQYSTQSYCLLSVYPTPSCTLSGRSYNWLLITLQPTRMLNTSRESAWRDMASNQRCFLLIQFEPFHMHAMQFTSLHTSHSLTAGSIMGRNWHINQQRIRE